VIPENIATNRPTPLSSRNIECFQTCIKTVRVLRYVGDIQISHIYTPRRAKRALDIAKRTIQNQQKKIKALKQSQRRLVTRLKTMEGLIEHLKQKNLLSEATAENLMVISSI